MKVFIYVTVLILTSYVYCQSSFTIPDQHIIETPSGIQKISHDDLRRMLRENTASGPGFFDRTYLPGQVMQKFDGIQPTLPKNCTRQTLVNDLIDLINIGFVNDNLEGLTSFLNRFYTSTPGVKSAEWIYNQYQTMIDETPSDNDISVQFFNHTEWPQPSVVTRIEGVGENKDELVIIGAHLDSVNWQAENQDLSSAPGACDDGSGIVTVMEAFRVIAESGLSFNRTLEFHSYAAEEVGLLGSEDIANTYASQGIKVAGYLNFDMDAYPGNPGLFNIITDYTDESLNNFLMELITTYSVVGYTTSDCGYGCSDHASWNDAGYRASFAIENGPFPTGHSADDKMEYLFLPYALEYCQVALGFMVEVGTWQGVLDI